MMTPRSIASIAMKCVFGLFGLLAVLLLPLHSPRAHEERPGFLEIRAIAANVFLMTWKIPAHERR